MSQRWIHPWGFSLLNDIIHLHLDPSESSIRGQGAVWETLNTYWRVIPWGDPSPGLHGPTRTHGFDFHDGGNGRHVGQSLTAVSVYTATYLGDVVIMKGMTFWPVAAGVVRWWWRRLKGNAWRCVRLCRVVMDDEQRMQKCAEKVAFSTDTNPVSGIFHRGWSPVKN